MTARQEINHLRRFADVPAALASLTVRLCHAQGYDLATIRRDGRMHDHVRVRWLIAKQARAKGFSYPQIGRALNRDHTTIITAVRRAG